MAPENPLSSCSQHSWQVLDGAHLERPVVGHDQHRQPELPHRRPLLTAIADGGRHEDRRVVAAAVSYRGQQQTPVREFRLTMLVVPDDGALKVSAVKYLP